MAVRSSAAAAVVALGLLAPLVARGAESDTYRATGTPAAGNPGLSATLAPALAAPVIAGPLPTLTNQTSASFAFSHSDEPNVTFSCKLDDGEVETPCLSPKTYTVSDGGHTFAVRATDAAGDFGEATHTWTVDTTPPSQPTIVGPPSLTNQPSATFTFSLSGEPNVTFFCKLDVGDVDPCTSPKNYTVLHGPHTLAVHAEDAAGNIGAASTYDWTVDTAPPNTTITSHPALVTSSTSATFRFSSTKGQSTFECRLDSRTAFEACSSPRTYDGLAEGTYTFRVRATDKAGNTDQSPASFTWRVDATAPAAPIISSGPPTLTNQTSASFAFSHGEPGVTHSCKLEGGDFGPCTSPATYTGLTDGAHTFAVRATDGAGSVGEATRSWTIDTVAPDTVVSSGPSPASSSGSATFSFSSTEAGSSFSCSLDGAAFATCVSPRTYDGLANRTHTFRVQATDAATNTDQSPASSTWTVRAPTRVDNTPPGNVRNVAKSVRYRLLKLRWKKPSDADFHHVVVLVGKNPKRPPTTRVYRGAGTSYTNSKFRNGFYYRYAITSYDRSGNASRKVGVVVPAGVLLTAPRAGARLRRPPLLDWASVPKATYYNVQLYLGSKKVFTAWPGRSSLRLKQTWPYQGGFNRLKAGRYHWFVFPGFGRRSQVDYGGLLGQASFVITN